MSCRLNNRKLVNKIIMKKFFLTAAVAVCLATTSFAQNNWMMKVHMKSGDVKEIPCDDVENITFDKMESELYASVNVTNTYNLYYGAVSNKVGMYMLHLCDGELTTGGLPTEINKHDIRLTVMAAPSDNSDNASLPSGTYSLNDNPNAVGIYQKQCVYIETNSINSKGQVDGFLDSLKVATLNVENKGNGMYHLELEGELNECGKIEFNYDGKLTFVNKDKNVGYDYITENVDFKPLGMSGRYVKAKSTYCDYSIVFYNTELDGEGFVVGAGGLLNMVLLTSYAVPMDINNIVGTYDVVMPVQGAVYEPGKFIGGSMIDTGYGALPMGTYYSEVDDEGYDKAYGMLNGGTVKVTLDGNDLTFDCNWTTPQGKTVVMNYTGDVRSIIDQSEDEGAYGVKADVRNKGIAGAVLGERINVKSMNSMQNKVYLIKR